MLRFLKNLLLLVFIALLPVLAKFHYADPSERAAYFDWFAQWWGRPVTESLTEVVSEVKQRVPEAWQTQFRERAESFQPLLNCGKTETLAVSEESRAIYRWVDDSGQVHFSDKVPGALRNSAQMSVHYDSRKRYFDLQITADSTSLPVFVRDKISADVRQIFGILSRDMAVEHLRRVLLNVRIIESQQAFQAYRAQVAPQLATNSGFYTSKNNEAVVFQDADETRMLAVVRHEAAHVIVAGLYGYTPVWFNEGLAEYFEQLTLQGQLRQVSPAAYHLRHLRQLEARNAMPSLREYLQLPAEQWYGDKRADHYALAWSLVYFLMSDEAGRALLSGMMNRLAENYCWQFRSVDYLQQHYPGGLTALEKNWQQWLQHEPTPHRY